MSPISEIAMPMMAGNLPGTAEPESAGPPDVGGRVVVCDGQQCAIRAEADSPDLACAGKDLNVPAGADVPQVGVAVDVAGREHAGVRIECQGLDRHVRSRVAEGHA